MERVPERSTLRNEFDSLGARLYIAKKRGCMYDNKELICM